jgi:predicted aspartyl protease
MSIIAEPAGWPCGVQLAPQGTMRIAMICLLSALLVTGCQEIVTRTATPAEVEPGEVEFALRGPGEAALVIPVTINGTGPYDFVLDTGATLTCIDSALAAELELPEARGIGAVATGIGGGGATTIVRIESLTVGSATAGEITACLLDLEQFRAAGIEIQGLLGLNFLRSYTVTLDFERRVARFDEPGAGREQ